MTIILSGIPDSISAAKISTLLKFFEIKVDNIQLRTVKSQKQVVIQC